MKSPLSPEQVRLMQSALEVRDTLRSLANRLNDADRTVVLNCVELLKDSLKAAGARRHSLTAESRPPWETR